jgi:hypothetical protein
MAFDLDVVARRIGLELVASSSSFTFTSSGRSALPTKLPCASLMTTWKISRLDATSTAAALAAALSAALRA